jgi:hypothetical protein
MLGSGAVAFLSYAVWPGGQLQVIGITGKKCSDNSSGSMRLRPGVPASFPTTWGAPQSCAEPPEARWSRSSCFSGHAPSRQPNSANVLEDVCVTSGTNRTWAHAPTTGSSSELQSKGASPARDSPYQRSSIVPIVRQSGHAMVGKISCIRYRDGVPESRIGTPIFRRPALVGFMPAVLGSTGPWGSTPEIKGKQRRGS